MAQVTIEGSKTTPTTFLAPGRRITVERTSYINKLLSRGYVDLIEEHAAEAQAEPETKAEDAPETDLAVPAESAAKSMWADFLDTRGVTYPADSTKAQMIEAWNASQSVD